MFSGIIQTTAPVIGATPANGCVRIRIKKPARWKIARGASVSVDGICSTVVRAAPRFFEVEYVPETLARTTAREFGKGRAVNLERSLRYGDPIEGHFVQGHVEGRGYIVSIFESGRSRELSIALPPSLMRSVIPKGSIAINGVSLTIARKRKTLVTVALIPYTSAHTNLGTLAVGDAVNVETDMLARHAVARGGASGRVTRNAPKENSHNPRASKRRPSRGS
jgi:riboflavin synthase alpha subunit